MGWIVGLTRILWFLVIQGINGVAQELKSVDKVDIRDRTWDVQKNFCRLLAHTSKDIHLFTQHSFR